MRLLLKTTLNVLALLLALTSSFAELDISSLHGAGLLEKQGPYRSGHYREADFQYLSQLGANFVRLPISYLFLAKDGNPSELDEAKLKELDQVIAWGRQYGLHVCLNLFATPGYAIEKPKQTPSLWTDEESQRTFTAYWETLARRYRDIPPEALSFNLLNEPPWGLPEDQYAPVMRRAIGAVHAISPDRWIFVDGLDCGARPVLSLAGEPKVAQALHFYEPFSFTHYGAFWLGEDGPRLPRPTTWPAPGWSSRLFGPQQDHHSPVVIEGTFPENASLRVHVGQAEGAPVELAFLCDGRPVSSVVFEKSRWVDRAITFPVPAGPHQISLSVTKGDQLTLRELALASPAQSWLLSPGSTEWEPQKAKISFDPPTGLATDRLYDRAWIADSVRKAWQPLMDRHVPIMVQEFGCHNQTPTAAAAAYLRDCIAVWKQFHWGWAPFACKGTLGWLDSERPSTETRQLPNGTTVDVPLEDIMKKEFADP